MTQREEFVLKALQTQVNLTALCKEYNISRKTAYKWLQRFRERGVRGLEDMARGPAPGHRKLRCSADLAIEILQIRSAHPTWGPAKLRAVLLREHAREDVPSTRTIARVLLRAGVARYRKARPGKQPPGERPDRTPTAPNELWTVDFKGWWRTQDGKKCEPLTVRDAFSRYILAIVVVDAPSVEEVRPVFERLFRDHGLPKAIRSDNGTPFVAPTGLRGLTRLSAWWIALGLEHERSRVGCPQDNGGHERMHLDMSKELERSPALDRGQQQAACDRWRHEFNHERPHSALGNATPASVYRRSSKVLPDGEPSLNYPSHILPRRVSSCGTVRYVGLQRHLSAAIAGYDVGFEPLPEGRFKVWFGEFCLGTGTLPWTVPLIPWAGEEEASPSDPEPTPTVTPST